MSYARKNLGYPIFHPQIIYSSSVDQSLKNLPLQK